MKSTYTITKVLEGSILIADMDLGKTVTNDAENVVAEITEKHPDKRIYYKDTEGRIDELTHDGKSFTGFRSPSPEELNLFKDVTLQS